MTYEVVDGTYAGKQEHSINDPILNKAVAALEGASIKFSTDVINDANVRQSYTSNIKRSVSEIKQMVSTKKISVKEAAEFCYEMRNQIMAEHRKFTSAQGLAFAERHKKTPPSFEKLIDKYSQKKFGKVFSNLTPDQKSKIYYEIIEASARDNPKFTTANKRLKVIGKVGIIFTAVLATHEVLNAENKPKEAIKQGIQIGGGAAGGALAGLTVSPVCGPGAPVCAVVLVLVGSAAGAIVGSVVADTLDEEIEEFTRWAIN
ncbi:MULTISPECIES: hypothetical protein [Xenorhabdus]|uniref:hypothetical protein n=1 Tax=Xenorhabdus TaxID=626 RepID=UPI00064AB324|nr:MULTISPECIES: hypothetical protein [Xenorhabdus]KLU16260.1 hypothetical protein AAY47_06675 [Xenorhabdus griffiniae]KOP32345.1 hypothetical protein AFK69_15740 [Xenorhabdus sp. GDc328]WFQ80969.1 hypothetical protein PXH59_07725 [Xenorhabdus sp. SF857]